MPPSASAPALERARAILRRYYAFPDFRPGQRLVVHGVLGGRDVLAVLPTGAGKSVCFQVPALVRGGLSIVVSPLIALMQDQVEAARSRGLPAARLDSTLDPARRREVLAGVRAGTVRLLYAAPERLGRLAGELDAMAVRPRLLVVDEAHCISEWGHDFRPAYRALGRARRELGWPQAVAVTGSATAEVRRDIIRTLGLGRGRPSGRLLQHVGSFDRPNLWFGVARVPGRTERLRALLELLRRTDGAAIVYLPTRRLSEAAARVLWQTGVRALPYHAGLAKEHRTATLARFLAGDARVVAATCAFGMGIDKPDVRLVVHWTFPSTPEAYYQEAGRAGRDGAPARCVVLFSPGDVTRHQRLLEVTFPAERLVARAWADPEVLARLPMAVRVSIERLRAELRPDAGPVDWRRVRRRRRLAGRRLAAMTAWVAGGAGKCRRRALLAWFGERLARCGGCDACDRGRA